MNDIILPGVKPEMVKSVSRRVLPTVIGGEVDDGLMKNVGQAIESSYKLRGYLDKNYFVETVTKAYPYFADVANNFIDRVTKTAELSIELNCKQYDTVLQYILSNSEILHEQKLKECRELLIQEQRLQIVKDAVYGGIILGGLGIVGATHIKCVQIKTDAAVEKARIAADTAVKIAQITSDTATQIPETIIRPIDKVADSVVKVVDTIIVKPFAAIGDKFSELLKTK